MRILRGAFAPSVLALCMLTSACIPVDDFGSYWESGTLDPALAGAWSKFALPGIPLTTSPGPPTLSFENGGTSYAIRNSEGAWVVRTLRIGRHTFLMTRGEGKPDGMLQRYALERNVLRIYMPANPAMMTFLESRRPAARSITRTRGGQRYIVVKSLDAEAYGVLSELADESYWELVSQYRKE